MTPGASPPVVTVLTSSFGGGHRMIAKSVAGAVRELRPDWDVELLDFFEQFVGSRFSRGVAWSYGFSARNAPYLYGAFYRVAYWVGLHPRLQGWLNRVGSRRLRDHVLQRRPRVVVHTYPTPSAVVAGLKRRGEISVPSVTVLTDFESHSQWTHAGVDAYLVGHECVRDELIGSGVPAEIIQVTGVPIRPGFVPRDEYPADGPVLITVGAEGMLRHAEKLCRLIAQQAPRTIVVCGRDQRLQRQLAPLAESLGGRLEVYGFVEDIHRHYARASLLIGKVGGVTVSEAMAVGLPILVYGAIPGQEHANERFVVESGAGLAARTVEETCRLASDLLSHPDRLLAMAQRAQALGRPTAARDAAQAIIGLCEGR